MDTMREAFIGSGRIESDDDARGESAAPAPAIMGDERRMQVRAYNFWASLLGDRQFPDIAQLQPDRYPDFGPYSVLLDFSRGVDDPEIAWLGASLAQECGAQGAIGKLDQIPSRSLLSRITDHYMQILANEAPIGFEAEFVNLRGATVLYRGILLPFSQGGGDRIDWIYGVINWKELADQAGTDQLMRQLDDTLMAHAPLQRDLPPLGGWADGPAEPSPVAGAIPDVGFGARDGESTGEGDGGGHGREHGGEHGPLPLDAFMELQGNSSLFDESDILELTADMELADWLASARELARAAMGCEDRSRQALYAAIGRAYDFVLAAAEAPGQLAELLEDAGLKVQERAPLVPLMKLVFGPDYDKTRLAEFASVIVHARRLDLARGALASFLVAQPGGIKAVVREERRLRRAESDLSGASETRRQTGRETRRQRLAHGLRALAPKALDDVARDSEFTVLIARRTGDGEVIVLGEVKDDAALLDRAARRLIGGSDA